MRLLLLLLLAANAGLFAWNYFNPATPRHARVPGMEPSPFWLPEGARKLVLLAELPPATAPSATTVADASAPSEPAATEPETPTAPPAAPEPSQPMASVAEVLADLRNFTPVESPQPANTVLAGETVATETAATASEVPPTRPNSEDTLANSGLAEETVATETAAMASKTPPTLSSDENTLANSGIEPGEWSAADAEIHGISTPTEPLQVAVTDIQQSSAMPSASEPPARALRDDSPPPPAEAALPETHWTQEMYEAYRLESAPLPAAAPSAPPTGLCYRTGIMDSRAQAEQVIDWFAKKQLRAALQSLPAKELLGYRVYLPPLASKAAAQYVMVVLKQRGVNNPVLLSSGDMANAISLGVFRQEKDADQRIKQLKNAGYPTVRKQPMYRMQTDRFWLLLELSPGQESWLKPYQETFKHAPPEASECPVG